MEIDYDENATVPSIYIIRQNIKNTSGSQSADDDELWIQPNFREISVYSVLFVIAAVGNLTVFISLFRSRHRKSRISLMITHLAIADLIVTFIMIPLEVGWRLTGRWLAGNIACKVFLFLRVLGPYLSSNILVCVSLDRYFAVLYPLRVNDARRRGKIMLTVAWSASFMYCVPQSFIFSVKTHPKNPNFTQCVSFEFFSTPSQEIAYNFLCVMFMYFIPLLVIVVAYTAIVCEISRNSKSIQKHSDLLLGLKATRLWKLTPHKKITSITKKKDYACESQPLADGKMRLRRSAVSNIEKAKNRTLKMTITIVAVYLWCCTPYAIMTLWYMIDRESAEQLPEWLQETFFIMVVTNSCMNPIIYGSYIITCKRNCKYVTCINRKHNILNNDGEIQASHGSKNYVRQLLKCFFRPKKGKSPTTRSTPIKNTLPHFRTTNESHQLREIRKFELKEERSHSTGCPPCAARVSFADSSTSSRSQGMSFYSEPLTNPLGFTCDGYKLSEPDLCSKSASLAMNIHQVKVQYHHRGHQH